MSERAMQFWVGLFVISGLCILLVLMNWFGDLPHALKPRKYLKVAYPNAAGVGIGTPIHKSGIRVGEVTDIVFDTRDGHEDGVLVTMVLDKEFPLTVGSKPIIARGLLGDTAIDVVQGKNTAPLPVGFKPQDAPIIEGEVRADPAKAVEVATEAISKATSTLDVIDEAARGIARTTSKFESAGDLIDSWAVAGKKLTSLSDSAQRLIQDNEDEIRPMIASMRQASEKVNGVLDDETRQNLRQAISRADQVLAKLDDAASGLSDLKTVSSKLSLVADEISDTRGEPARTQLGQAVQRINRIAYDLSLLSNALNDGNNRLNPNGSIQRLLLSPSLANNMNQAVTNFNDLIINGRMMLDKLNRFSDKIANDPSALTRGALTPR